MEKKFHFMKVGALPFNDSNLCEVPAGFLGKEFKIIFSREEAKPKAGKKKFYEYSACVLVNGDVRPFTDEPVRSGTLVFNLYTAAIDSGVLA